MRSVDRRLNRGNETTALQPVDRSIDACSTAKPEQLLEDRNLKQGKTCQQPEDLPTGLSFLQPLDRFGRIPPMERSHQATPCSPGISRSSVWTCSVS